MLIFAAAVLVAGPAAAQQAASTTSAQPAGVQSALANDLGNLSDKFTGLARVMAGKYDWRPMPGVRSVADVFNLIVNENHMIKGLITGTGGGRGGMQQAAPITDPEKMQEALRTSYTDLKQALSGLSESDLNAPVKLFGRDTTKQGAVLMLIFDQHEHLGQSIAYARTNTVVPPWSK
jgi:uncharacterized damage-inducible protein DinB